MSSLQRWVFLMICSLAIFAAVLRCEKDTTSYPFIEKEDSSAVSSLGLNGEPCVNNYFEWNERHLIKEMLKMLQVLNGRAIPQGYVYYLHKDTEGMYHLKKREHGFGITDSLTGTGVGELRTEYRGLSQ